MVLVLEDSPERAALMHQRLPERDRVMWAKTAMEAISVLKDYSERLEKIYIDHDLEGLLDQDSRAETSGAEVIRFLEHAGEPIKSHLMKADFVIHSHSRQSPKMAQRLMNAGYRAHWAPFGE